MSSEENNDPFIQWHFNKPNASNFVSYSHPLFLLLYFISILIFVPSLFLCIHFCRRRFSQQQHTSMPNTVIFDHQWVRVDFTKYHTNLVGEGFEKSTSDYCCICLSLFQENEKLKVLKECQHAYHSECLDMWLFAHPNCPLCRASLHVSNPLKKSVI